MSEIVVEFERRIAASPAVVFRYLTESARWKEWQGTEVALDPRPGGEHRVNITGDGFASGSFVEVIPHRRVVFTWGFEHPNHPIPPGSTLIEIDLEPVADGTLLRFRQSAVPTGFEVVATGWNHYLNRLQAAAIGTDPGPDPNRVAP